MQAIPMVHLLVVTKPDPKHRATNWVTNLLPKLLRSSQRSCRLCHSQARDLLKEISPQALNDEPWPSVESCFPSCTVPGCSASIAAVLVPSETLRGWRLARAVPAPAGCAFRGGNCFQRMSVTRMGLSHPSHPALIGYPASEAKE